MQFESPQLYISYKVATAKTPEKLEELMLILQVSAGKPLDFTPPQFANGKWSVWYMYDYSQDIRPEMKVKMESK